MSWARIDDNYPDHPKLVDAGYAAMALDLAAICYANRYLSDGFISEAAAQKLLAMPRSVCAKAIGDLVRVGRWEETTEGGYRIHDYLEYNPSREQVLRDRAKAKERMDKVRANKGVGSDDVRANNRRSSGEVRSTPSPSPSPRDADASRSLTPRGKPKRITVVSEDFTDKLTQEFSVSLGGPLLVRDHIDAAMGHKGYEQWNDKQRYVRNWLRREAEKARNGHEVTGRNSARGRESEPSGPAGGW